MLGSVFQSSVNVIGHESRSIQRMVTIQEQKPDKHRLTIAVRRMQCVVIRVDLECVTN